MELENAWDLWLLTDLMNRLDYDDNVTLQQINLTKRLFQ